MLLVRQAETDRTLSSWHTSFTDVSLTAHGEQRVRAVAPLLARRPISKVLASPSRRALCTAALAGLTDWTEDADLREWNYGGYEGATTAEIHCRRPALSAGNVTDASTRSSGRCSWRRGRLAEQGPECRAGTEGIGV